MGRHLCLSEPRVDDSLIGAMPVVVKSGRWSTKRNWLLSFLLALATVQCVQSIFTVNLSFLVLDRYADGQERMPFQGRIAMMPVVRWAAGNHAMQQAAVYVRNNITRGRQGPAEGYSAAKLGVELLGIFATLVTVGFAAAIGWRHLPEVWWLPPALFIYMLFVTYAARSMAPFWYPYDLPHFALFGMAAICILEGWYAAAFGLFLLDLPVRETSIYLVPLLLAMGYVRRQWKVVPWAAAMFVLWIPLRIYVTHRYAANGSDVEIQWGYWRHTLSNPWRWGQAASAFGYLVVPFVFGFKYLNREERFFVYAALPGIFFTTLYGVWLETRIWDEWLLPAAFLMSLQSVRCVAARGRAGLLGEPLN